MCVSKRNLIQYMGDMALMAIMCEKWPIFMWFLMIFWTFGVQMGPISFTRRPMNDYFIFGTLNPVCNNEKFDSMYGWYGSNPQNMWKIANFGWFLMIFLGPLEPRWDPISFSRHPMNDNFIFGTLNHVCTKEKFDSMYGWYGSNGHYMWKIANFGDFWWFFGPLEPRWDPISFTWNPMNDYFIFGTLNPVCTNEKFDSMYGWLAVSPRHACGWKRVNVLTLDHRGNVSHSEHLISVPHFGRIFTKTSEMRNISSMGTPP